VSWLDVRSDTNCTSSDVTRWGEAETGSNKPKTPASPSKPTANNIALMVNLLMLVCDTMDASGPGAQTERRGDAGPVRSLLGGKDLTGRFAFL
jgi:hypothetical protein